MIKPIPQRKFQIVEASLYRSVLPNFYWLSSDFSACYRFMNFPLYSPNATEQLLIMHATSPNSVLLDEYYSLREDRKAKRLIIDFLNDSYTVQAIKIHYEEITSAAIRYGAIISAILQLSNSRGESLSFYAASSDPFNPVYRQMYEAS